MPSSWKPPSRRHSVRDEDEEFYYQIISKIPRQSDRISDQALGVLMIDGFVAGVLEILKFDLEISMNVWAGFGRHEEFCGQRMSYHC
jgi:hypothetical protein